MDIDISKENIQPLRGGRNLAQLGTALQAQSDADVQRQLQLQKEEHEASIRSYAGPDPLEPWFNYIQWIEQCFPKHGHEGHIDKLIKECLQIFEKDERYFQDRRFVKLWIKYIDCLTNPLEIYQRLHNSGIGVECSELYRAWACYCEESGDYKKANQVYMLGLQAQAQPLDELEQAHMNFQLFFAQRMLHDDSPTKRKAASALAETRMALTSLKTFKRRNIASAPVQRTGEAVRSVAPGVVRQQATDPRPPPSNIMLSVYEDAPSTSAAGAGTGVAELGPASLVQACGEENEREVGVWSSAKTKMVRTNLVPHQPLPFTPYEDEVIKLSANHMPYCVDDLRYTVPLCVPDPVDPTKIPCYNKQAVYVDDTEYSLEEIRSRKYTLKRNTKLLSMSRALEHHYAPSADQAASCSALETLANCALDSEHDHLEQLMPLQIPALQNITKVHNVHSPGEPKVLVNLDSKEFSEMAHSSSFRKKEDSQRALSEMSEKDFQKASVGYGDGNAAGGSCKNNLAEEFNRSLLDNLHGDSITVNTKEARWELRHLFNANEPSIVEPVVQQFQMPKFDIHEDRSMTVALHTKKKSEASPEPVAPQDKENANKVFPEPAPDPAPPPAQQNVTKTTYYEEPSCTQVFNFNIKNSSTPNMSQFKKPSGYGEGARAPPPKYSLEEGPEGARAADGGGEALSVIMESTRELNSKSGSSSSGHQSTRTTMTGYTTRDSQAPYGERTQASNLNYDSMYAQQNDPAAVKRNSMPVQPRQANGQFAKTYQKQQTPDHNAPELPPAAYHTHDHQYQKPMPNSYNGYSAHRTMQAHGYQQAYAVSYPQGSGYTAPQMTNQQAYTAQQGYASPGGNNYHSPQHPGIQSPTPVQPGFQSPPQSYSHPQAGYQSPVQSAQPSYQHVQTEYAAQPTQRQHAYAGQPQAQASFQSPPHQAQYAAPHLYQRTSSNYPNAQASPAFAQQNYHEQYHGGQYGNTNQSFNNQNYQSTYRQPTKLAVENNYEYPASSANPVQFQVYQSPNQSAHANYQATSSHSGTVPQARPQPMQTSPDQYSKQVGYANSATAKPRLAPAPTSASAPDPTEIPYQNKKQSSHDEVPHRDVQNTSQNAVSKLSSSPNPPVPYKSPTSILRSVRHEQPHGKTMPDAGFSHQFLNFITSRNEPKDNANTPKFTNSPNISQKMHKNLYVSSPEQAQMPPSSGQSDSDSKDGLTARSATPIQAAKTLQMYDKQKDPSKRQLDFEHRAELQSEDSRDSTGKESRISSVHSRQSVHSDGYGMDMDSENSMECAAYKSVHSISLVDTSELPRPADIHFPEPIDPFSKKLLNSLLEYVKFPNKTHADGYVEVRSVPKMQVNTLISVGNHKFSVDKQLGKGNYGAVFCCLDLVSHKSVAVKYQKPSRPWEFYICQEIKARIKDPFMLPGYMDINLGFLGDNASIFVSELSKYGSLLDVANKIRVATSKTINEDIVLLLTSEMLSILHYLHKAEIIHADVKPDNFLLMKIPTQEWRTPSLQLIDLGCAIDMSLFPQGTTFRKLITTEGFTCTEMREGKPWTYQTDLYCLAGTIHVILMGSYMKVVNRLGQWNIDKKLPRYMKATLWDKIFTSLLNVADCGALPDLMELKGDVDEVLSKLDNLAFQLRNFANVLKSR